MQKTRFGAAGRVARPWGLALTLTTVLACGDSASGVGEGPFDASYGAIEAGSLDAGATMDGGSRPPAMEDGGTRTGLDAAREDAGACSGESACACPDGQEWDAIDETCVVRETCRDDEGWDPTTGTCLRCSPALSCGSTGETGRLLATTSMPGGACICETLDGYFPGSEGHTAEACDADGDGWVNDRAQPAIEARNHVIRQNARCRVRRIHRVFLENEAGQVLDLGAESEEEDLTRVFSGDEERALPPGLPLYESSRNDSGTASELPYYGTASTGRALTPSELNSLTKACIGITTDANHNGVVDVSEWSHSPSEGRSFANAELASYYARYTQYAYFLELHDGMWEPLGEAGVYRIAERPRSGTLANSAAYDVPLRYPAGTPDYALTCKRHTDARFTFTAEGALSAPHTLGGDFVRFQRAKMMHHSQYKCIQGDGNLTQNASLNSCHAVSSTTKGVANNPSFAEIQCSVLDTPVSQDSVHWAAMHYQHYTSPYVSVSAPGGYESGCINECVDEGAAATSCWDCTAQSWGEVAPKPVNTPCGEGGACNGAGRCDACQSGNTRCKTDRIQQVCTEDRVWQDNVSCQFGCSNNTCFRDCAPGTQRCSAQGVPQRCDGTGQWRDESACPLRTQCRGLGQCLRVDGEPCASAGQCASGVCTSGFVDSDGDGHGSTAVAYCGTFLAGTSAVGGDCCDADARAFPGQTGYFTTPRAGCGGYDFNCNGTDERESGSLLGCSYWSCQNVPQMSAWVDVIPACGQQGRYGPCIDTGGGCRPAPGLGQKTQACR